MDNIFYIKNVFDSKLVDEILYFFNKNTDYYTKTMYANGENTKVSLLSILYLSDNLNYSEEFNKEKKILLDKVIDELKYIIINHKIPYLADLISSDNLYMSAIDLKKIYGPTRRHIDGSIPAIYIDKTTSIITRIATIIVTLTDNSDIIHFPYQNMHIPLEKNSMIIFPPYWTHPHFTTHDPSMIRISLQTWLLEKNTIEYLNHSHIIQVKNTDNENL